MFVRTLLITAAVAVAGLLAGQASVAAHSDYESSVPAANEVVAESPAQVDVFFTQDVIKIDGRFHVRVLDANGTLIAGDGTVDDDDRRHISTELPEPLAEGLYIVEWMTTSDEDGDSADGSFCFSVVAPMPDPLPEACEEEPLEATPTLAEATPTAAPSDAGEPTAVPTEDDQLELDDDGTSIGVIIAIVVGVVVAAAVIGGAAFVMFRRSQP